MVAIFSSLLEEHLDSSDNFDLKINESIPFMLLSSYGLMNKSIKALMSKVNSYTTSV